jgi:hypothetical protein
MLGNMPQKIFNLAPAMWMAVLKKNPLFSTYDEWKVHVQSKDHKQFRGWTCLLCKMSPKLNDEHTLLQHMQKEHPKAVAKESLANFVKNVSLE